MRPWILVSASLAILLILARAAGFHQIAGVWKSLPLSAVALSVACYFASIAARIVSWKLLLGPAAPRPARLAPPLALGFVLGYAAPAKAGEPATAYLVSRDLGIPLASALSALAAERGLQLVVLLATFVSASAAKAGDLLALRGAVCGAALLLAASIAALFLAPAALPRLAALVRRVPRVGMPAASSLDALDAVLRDRPKLLRLVALAGLFWTLQYVSLWAILNGGGAAVDLTSAAVVAGAAILGGTLTLLPLGTQDGISALVLAAFGVPAAIGFSLALFHTALSLACGAALVVVLPWFTGRERIGR